MVKSTAFLISALCLSLPALAKVQGLYGSDCLRVEGLSAYKDLAFDNESLKQVQTVYVDEQCQMAAYEFIFEGPYLLNETDGSLNYSFSSINLTPLGAHIAENFNSYELCGISTWSAGQSKNVAGLNCGGQQIPVADKIVYDRLFEAKDDIRMGRATDELNGDSADQRPDTLDDIIYHAR